MNCRAAVGIMTHARANSSPEPWLCIRVKAKRNQQTEKPRKSRLTKPLLFCVTLAVGFATWVAVTRGPHAMTSPVRDATKSPPLLTYAGLCAAAPEELAKLDVALMNLLCAEGLPGAEGLDVTNCLARLDQLASYIRNETARNHPLFIAKPQEFKHSEGYFNMMMLVTVLQQDVKIRYNPNLIQSPDMPLPEEDHFFDNAQDIFIHGLVRDDGLGTCSSMPVLLVAFGRRLGYSKSASFPKEIMFDWWGDYHDGLFRSGTSPNDFRRDYPNNPEVPLDPNLHVETDCSGKSTKPWRRTSDNFSACWQSRNDYL